MPALTAGSGRPPNLPEVERAMPAKAHNNHRDMPRKSNGTTRAGRCTDASPARQARINSPEQSLKHRCQAVPGRLTRPAVLEQCPRLRRFWAALSFDPAGRTVTRSHCCLRLTRGQPCLGGSAAIACSTRRGSVGAVPLSQAPLLSEAREVDSAGPNRQLVGLIRSRDPDVLPRRKHNRNPSGGAPCNPMKKSREEHLRKSLFRHLLPKGHLPRISH